MPSDTDSPLPGTLTGACILRRPEVEAATGLSRSAIYAGMKAGTFPPAVSLSPKAVGWRTSDIFAWLEQRPVAQPAPMSSGHDDEEAPGPYEANR
jgi:prophage regulatory protein